MSSWEITAIQISAKLFSGARMFFFSAVANFLPFIIFVSDLTLNL